MNPEKNLVLVGMMGSGKSTIGFLLSKKLKIPFFDIDKIIEKNEKISIKEIFNQKGEDYFRKIEEKISIRYLSKNNSVISLGGGAFLNYKIRKAVKEHSKSFWLSWKNRTLIERIKKSKKRPLAYNYNNFQLKRLIFRRIRSYKKANFKINCNNLNKNKIVSKIVHIYENK